MAFRICNSKSVFNIDTWKKDFKKLCQTKKIMCKQQSPEKILNESRMTRRGSVHYKSSGIIDNQSKSANISHFKTPKKTDNMQIYN